MKRMMRWSVCVLAAATALSPTGCTSVEDGFNDGVSAGVSAVFETLISLPIIQAIEGAFPAE
ncbi:MAG: hypothetical protein FLDDKLPJ_00518 [Phycisphaerae bacterium]|nr:hypothetical protein [Phycisphaerae bacterium]